MRGKAALLVPKNVTSAGASALKRDLQNLRVKVLGTAENLVLVRFDRKARGQLSKTDRLKAVLDDRIGAAVLRSLPPRSRRIATLWNWSLSNKGKRTTDASVQKLMKKLNLTVDQQGNVFDSMARTRLGRVTRRETAEKKGNWWLYQTRGWEAVPVWFGIWRKYSTRTRSYVDQARTRRLVVDHIIAELDGPNHYSYQSRTNASSAYVYNWDYVWVWDADWCEHWSYARNGNSSLQITRQTVFRR